MATIDKLEYINNTKNLIKNALNTNFNSQIGDGDTFRSYIPKINNIYTNWPKITEEGTNFTLNSTKEGKVNNIVLKGNSSQAAVILPSEYTQVDYIESSGTQYIDTGYTFTSTKEKIKFNYTPLIIEDARVCGSYISGHKGMIIQPRQDSMAEVGQRSITPTFTITANTNYDVILEANNGNYSFTFGNDSMTGTYTRDPITNLSHYIFAVNFTGTATKATMKLYYYKMYDNDILVRNFVPCYRNSDNEVGLYDLVNNVFYTNSGTGTFTYGAVATLPNPNYPQDIHVVSGDNSIEVCGKNIMSNSIAGSKAWSGTQVNFIGDTIKITKNSSGGIAAGVYTNIRYFSLKAGEKYTFSISYKNGEIINTDATAGWAFYIYGVNKDGSTSTSVGYRWTCGLSRTTTTPSNHITFTLDKDFIGFKLGCYIPGGSPKTNGDVYFNCQLEKGELTSYEQYQSQTYLINLGDIELYKIGEYQDSIVKDNGKWYLNKQIGKFIPTGNETWTYDSTYNYCRMGGGTFEDNAVQNNNQMNTHFQYLTNSWNAFRNAKTTNGTFMLSSVASSNYQLCIRNVNLTKQSEYVTWIKENNPIFYYQLETPKTILITDNTLIEQLDNLEKAISYDEQTNITQINNDLPFILNVSALKKNSSN